MVKIQITSFFPSHINNIIHHYPCDKEGYCNRIQDFFARKQTTLGLKITNTPGTAKVLGSNLTASCFFFFKREILRFKKIFGLLFV